MKVSKILPAEAHSAHARKDAQQAKPSYLAELIGFGSLSSAQAFVDRLEKKGIKVSIKKRDSKSARGKLVSWYQVVTQPYDSHENLMRVVDVVKRDERLKGVHIITC